MSASGYIKGQLNNLVGAFFGTEWLRDYNHAAKTFRPNGYANAPKFKFLFHTYFDINPDVYPVGLASGANFGLLVKNIKLPSYTFNTHNMNQYNRKRIVQTKINYNPVDIEFHDDNGNLIRNLMYYYMLYYYNDTNKPYLDRAGPQIPPAQSGPGVTGTIAVNNNVYPPGYNYRNIYDGDITNDVDYGYIGESVQSPSAQNMGYYKIPFFRNITIYGFNQHNFVAYVLINPLIKEMSHDQYNYSQSAETMSNKMTLEYETVKYYQGAIDGRSPTNIVQGFGSQQNYDTRLSPLAKPGSQGNIFGQGGLVSGAGGAIQDLANGNILGAIQKAGTTYNTFKNVNIKQVAKGEFINGISQAVNPNVPNRNLNFDFPVFGSTPNKYGTAGSSAGGLTAPPTIKGPGGG
jgi:hypothetical protein